MAWISRTVFVPEEEEKEEENNEEAEVEVEEGLPPKRRERMFIAASSAYELLKLFYIWVFLNEPIFLNILISVTKTVLGMKMDTNLGELVEEKT